MLRLLTYIHIEHNERLPDATYRTMFNHVHRQYLRVDTNLLCIIGHYCTSKNGAFDV